MVDSDVGRWILGRRLGGWGLGAGSGLEHMGGCKRGCGNGASIVWRQRISLSHSFRQNRCIALAGYPAHRPGNFGVDAVDVGRRVLRWGVEKWRLGAGDEHAEMGGCGGGCTSRVCGAF